MSRFGDFLRRLLGSSEQTPVGADHDDEPDRGPIALPDPEKHGGAWASDSDKAGDDPAPGDDSDDGGGDDD